MKDSTKATIRALPPCDICGKLAHYDAKSRQGPWGYFCAEHFISETWGKLGLGLGQELIVESKNDDH